MIRSRSLAWLTAIVCLAGMGRSVASFAGPGHAVLVRLEPRVVEYGPAQVSISGIAAASVVVRLEGATDEKGLAYQWTPYRWRRLRPIGGAWRGVLPAPPLQGIYQLQFRLQPHQQLLQSRHWLLRVLAPGTLHRQAFATPRAVIRDFVSRLRGRQVLVALRRWPQAAFDHRDPRLNRVFVIAYAPRGRTHPVFRRGLFITTFRNGFNGHWRLLQATVAPYG